MKKIRLYDASSTSWIWILQRAVFIHALLLFTVSINTRTVSSFVLLVPATKQRRLETRYPVTNFLTPLRSAINGASTTYEWNRNITSVPIDSKQIIGTTSANTQTLRKDDVSHVAATVKNEVKEGYLVHRGRTAEMIFRSPSISGLVVFRGWTPEATRDLKQAIDAVVRNNPILTGTPYRKKKNIFDQGELWIRPGKYAAEKHEFLTQIKAPDSATDKSLSKMSSSELLHFAQESLFPSFGELELTSQQVQKKSPVFSCSLMLLPDSYAVFSAKVSHAVGDGVTFFQILKQLSLHMSGKSKDEVAPIDWEVASKVTHELYPPSFSRSDIDVSYGLPFILGLIKNGPTLAWRKQKMLLIDKNLVSEKKRQLRAEYNDTSISSNDVITTAICDMNDSTDVFVFTENARDGEGPIPRNAGGNFLWEIPIDKKAATDPIEFRKTVITKSYYATNKLPLEKFLCGRVGRLTSLATITEQVMYNGLETICTMPLSSFVHSIPMDVAIIFRFNKKYWAVLHNFAAVKSSKLLQDILAHDDEKI